MSTIDRGTPAPATPCPTCSGLGFSDLTTKTEVLCRDCLAIGYLDLDPAAPCPAAPGTSTRAAYYAARYRFGYPLWNDADAREHRPAEIAVTPDAYEPEPDDLEAPDDDLDD